MDLGLPPNAVVVVAGLPGVGKTTLIDRVADRATMRVLDTEDQRRAGHTARPRAVRIAVHYTRMGGAVLGRRPAVIHSRGTSAVARRGIVALARLRRRPAYLVLLVSSPEEARAGQVGRGRTIGLREMSRHVARLAALEAHGPARIAEREGWAAVHLLDRAAARVLDGLLAPVGRASAPPVPRPT